MQNLFFIRTNTSTTQNSYIFSLQKIITMTDIKIVAVSLLILLSACGSNTKPTTDKQEVKNSVSLTDEHQTFFNHLKSLCGKSFSGEQVFRSHHGESWAGRKMIMHVETCEDNQVYIPFHVDNDHSRTWMFVIEEGALVFRHQHLHEDGTQEDGSMYGGIATDEGTGQVQYFPADKHTAEVIDGGGDNLWIVSLDEELTTFSYRLDRAGEKRFEIVFDLTQPITE